MSDVAMSEAQGYGLQACHSNRRNEYFKKWHNELKFPNSRKLINGLAMLQSVDFGINETNPATGIVKVEKG